MVRSPAADVRVAHATPFCCVLAAVGTGASLGSASSLASVTEAARTSQPPAASSQQHVLSTYISCVCADGRTRVQLRARQRTCICGCACACSSTCTVHALPAICCTLDSASAYHSHNGSQLVARWKLLLPLSLLHLLCHLSRRGHHRLSILHLDLR